MRPPHDLKASIRLIAIAVLGVAVVATAIRVRHREDHREARLAALAEASLAAQLARCRSVTPAQLAVNRSCERVWAENRRQFFASGNSASIVWRGSGVSRASPTSQDIPASSPPHATATNVAPPKNVWSSAAASRKNVLETANQQPVTTRSNSSAAAPGEK